MSSTNFVRIPKATIQSSSGTGVLDSWNYAASVNGFPTMSWRTHGDSAGLVLPVTAQDNINLMSKIQTATFSGMLEEFEAEMTDGNGGTLTMKGYEMTPSFTTGVGASGVTHNGIHGASIITTFRPYIYTDGNLDMLGSEPLSESNITSRVARILEIIYSQFRKNDEDLQYIHSRNAELLEDVKTMLDVSTTFVQEIEDIKNPTVHSSINSWILATLRSPGIDLFSALTLVAREFKLFYAPPVDEIYPWGYFSTVSEAFTGGLEREVTLGTTTQISFLPGSRTVLPLGKVHVLGLRTEILGENGNTGNPELSEAKYPGFPDRPFPGRTDAIPPPVFLGTEILPQPPAGDGKTPPDPAEQAAARVAEAASSNLADLGKPVIELCKHFAKVYFYQNTLALSTAVINLALDLTTGWEVGIRYTIKLGEGDDSQTLFKGFLNGLTHSVQTEGSGGAARTTLNFTYVEIGDFSLADLIADA